MQTFLTDHSFQFSARDLDDRRLNNQINEGVVIWNAVVEPHRLPTRAPQLTRFPWIRHPATRMWADAPRALLDYIESCRMEAARRGLNDSRGERMREMRAELEALATDLPHLNDAPWWWRDEDVSARVTLTHRANLYFKAPGFYSAFHADYARAVQLKWVEIETGKPMYCWPCETPDAYARYRRQGKTC